MLMSLGLFNFQIDTLSFDELTRSLEWRHGMTERFQARPASQFLGVGKETISIPGTMIPELGHDKNALATLETMANSGAAQELVDGLGNVWGSFVILKLDLHRQYLNDKGQPRATGFTIELERIA